MHGNRLRRRLPTFTLCALTVAALGMSTGATAGAQQPVAGTTDVRLIAFNDLHGNLQPPEGSSGTVTLADGSEVDAGGAAYLAAHVRKLRAQAPNSVLLSSGDNIGASPLASALFHDEPTMALLNQLGVRAAAIGNHEFDEGFAEVQRMQRGGCHPEDGCRFRESYPGARFPILGANVTREDGTPALPPVHIEFSGGVPIGVIGLPLEDLPSVVSPDAVKGLKFGDEVRAINRASRALSMLGVRAQTVLMHNGDDVAEAGPNACESPEGPARAVAERASAEVDAVFQSHSHNQYNCTVRDPAGDPRPVIQGLSYGRLLSVVDLKISDRTRDVLREQTRAHNEVVTRDVRPDPAAAKLVDEAVAKAAPIANKKVGSVSGDLLRTGGKSGESSLGDVIADAQLAATKDSGAQLALMNPGGIRENLMVASSPAGEGDGVVTYGEAYAAQPFGNLLQTMTLTGEQLKAVLEQQWQGGEATVLQVSAGLHYSWSASAAEGSKVRDITINGEPVDPAKQYRVTVNNFLSAGGDGFTELTKGTDIAGGPVDLDAFTAYLGAHQNLAPPPSDRIKVVD